LRGGNLVVDEPKIRDATRQVVLPLWNVWYFLGLYANAAGEKDAAGKPVGYRGQTRYDSTDVMDRYLLARTGDLVRGVQESMTALAIADAAELIQDYLDMLTNWYVRRSRDRFWEGDEQAIDVLSTCLETLSQVTAPLLPMVAEEIWKQLTGGRSVHLTDWPDADLFPRDAELVAQMDDVRAIASVGNSLRKKEQLRARLPLAELAVVHHDPTSLEAFSDLLSDELNIKAVRLLDVASQEAQGMGVEQQLSVNARAAGPRLGKQVQTVIKGSKTGDWSVDEAGQVTSGGVALEEGEYSLDLVAGDSSAMEGHAVGVLRGGDFVALDTRVTPELEAEGTARDVVRAIQSARRAAGFDVSDRIRLTVGGDDTVTAAVATHRDLVSAEVLAVELTVPAAPTEGAHTVSEKVSGGAVTVSVARA
ncbi:MAG: DUF5915 domain-containing protein, partial [Brachybacterium sp.]